MAGDETINIVSGNEGRSTNGGGFNSGLNFGSSHGYNQSPSKRPLVTADVVMRSPRTAYIFTAGNDPILATPVRYYEDDAFIGVEGNRPLPKLSVPSLAIAALGIFTMLYLGLGLAWDSLPDRSGRTAYAAPGVAAVPNTAIPRAEDPATQPIDRFVRQTIEGGSSAPAAPLWPSEGICPRCKVTLPLPEDYSGQLLTCPDCSTQFKIPPL
jgi:hypothetical protein